KEIGDKIGIETGDKILAVDGNTIEKFDNVFMELINGNNMTLVRDGQIIEKEIPIDVIVILLENEDKMIVMTISASFMVNQVPDSSHSKNVDFRKGDEFLTINGSQSIYRDQVFSLLESNKGTDVDILVQREDGS